jgi:hypothetical protein
MAKRRGVRQALKQISWPLHRIILPGMQQFEAGTAPVGAAAQDTTGGDAMTTQTLPEEKLAAQAREAEARIDLLQAQAEAHRTKEALVEITGLRGAGERVRQRLTEMKAAASEKLDEARHAAEEALHELEARIDKVSDRYSEWDEARERHFSARLDEAEARLKVWKAQLDQRRAELGVQWHDTLATLEERIALARARAADRARTRHDRKTREALEAAARHFNEAYDAAAKRYEK